MTEIAIPLSRQLRDPNVERAIDDAIAANDLVVSLRGALRKFPGCIHWHVKRDDVPGTLEITFWPQEHRAWFTIHNRRQAAWMERSVSEMMKAIGQRTIHTLCNARHR